MGHKRRIQKKNFKCGHRGLGKYCHFCRESGNDKIINIDNIQPKLVPDIVIPIMEVESKVSL